MKTRLRKVIDWILLPFVILALMIDWEQTERDEE